MRLSALTFLMLGVVACGDDGTGAATPTGGGGANAGGEHVGGETSGGAPSGGAPAGGGGAGGAEAGCSPYDAATCQDGTHCVIVDDALGLNGGTACIEPGDHPVFSLCSSDADCETGTLCDRLMATCKPPCETDADCPGEAECYPAQTSAGGLIDGLKLCLAGCDPLSTLPCDQTAGPTNCVYRDMPIGFDCAPAGEGVQYEACVDSFECSTDLGCLVVNGNDTCLHWCIYNGGTDICTAEENPDAVFSICVPQQPSIAVEGVVYGGCVE